jgi:pyruvate formate lyase activating enzyme
VALAPLKKKPLYHYYPGKQILSVGFLGCNLHCPFCQNYSISQSTDRPTLRMYPSEVIDRAMAERSFGIAYTYNEPSIHYEFVSAAAALARKASLRNVLVTNGHLAEEPARKLLGHMDAVNVDLKSFNDQFYRSELGGSLEAIKQFIHLAAEMCHVEITTLLIAGRNNSEQELNAIAEFIASIDKKIPLHISAYYPTYHYTDPATTPEQVAQAVRIASRQLDYVYPGNIAGDTDTRCPSCGTVLVERRSYHVSTPGLRGSLCSQCGTQTPIVTG